MQTLSAVCPHDGKIHQVTMFDHHGISRVFAPLGFKIRGVQLWSCTTRVLTTSQACTALHQNFVWKQITEN